MWVYKAHCKETSPLPGSHPFHFSLLLRIGGHDENTFLKNIWGKEKSHP